MHLGRCSPDLLGYYNWSRSKSIDGYAYVAFPPIFTSLGGMSNLNPMRKGIFFDYSEEFFS